MKLTKFHLQFVPHKVFQFSFFLTRTWLPNLWQMHCGNCNDCDNQCFFPKNILKEINSTKQEQDNLTIMNEHDLKKSSKVAISLRISTNLTHYSQFFYYFYLLRIINVYTYFCHWEWSLISFLNSLEKITSYIHYCQI